MAQPRPNELRISGWLKATTHNTVKICQLVLVFELRLRLVSLAIKYTMSPLTQKYKLIINTQRLNIAATEY